MNAGLVWTIVGSAAAVVAIPIGVLQVLQGRRRAQASMPTNPAQAEVVDFLAEEALPPPVGRLPERVHGRDDLVGVLAGLVAAPDGLVHVLAGLGGCGKSTVALTVALQARDAGSRAWWVPAVDSASVTRDLLGLAQLLGAAESEVREARAGRINPSDVLWRRLKDTRGWVLVLDNADDPGVLAVEGRLAGDGTGWLRPTHAGLVVVTSRTNDARAWGTKVAALHEVELLAEGDGGQVLRDLAPCAGDAAEARALAWRLGGLPLALYQAGSYLGSPFAVEQTFAAYRQALAERFGDLLGRGDDERGRVIETWQLSLDALAAQGRGQARALLRVLSCFATAVPVPPVLLDPGMLCRCCGNEGKVEEGLSGLRAVGLINTRDPGVQAGRPLVVVHPLVAETIRYQAADADALAGSLAVAVDMLAAAAGHLDAEDPQDRAGWLALLPHMRALLAVEVPASAAALETLAMSAVEMSLALLRGGWYPASRELAESAIERIAELGGNHELVLALRVRRAAARRFLGHVAEAEVEFRQVLDAQLRVLGADHPSTLATRQEIARTLFDQGKPVEAEAEFRQVLDARQRILGPDHYDTLATQHYIARTLADQGKLVEAEAEFQQVLDRKRSVLGPDHPSTLATWHRVAYMLADLGKPVEAEAEFRQVFDARQRILGPDHPDTLDSRFEIARMLSDLGKPVEAEAEFRRVLEAQLRVLGAEHPSTVRTDESLQRIRHRDY